ncbi:putative selection and upkeep of intraepithelial T-cells protein 1 homolog isoform X2 [Mugil cephalus]|uniref:putative selection and upkeep of intraepithelial T-cells protein 1 homolog isoform X2 n=1 Tax=Mugil cephalus TaxID=48193 RepID=UPI001FB5C5B7|nr:putative selection and upkeep of intraepithelial T-cells protein 1 homolog isoform X2 [Mugil cephalus]
MMMMKMMKPRTLQLLSLLLLLLLLLLHWSTATNSPGHGSEVTRVVVLEGRDVVLPCSPSPRENMERGVFDWKKDGRVEVFFHEDGKHYSNNGRTGQDEQFKGRISHFPAELRSGNTSITIRNTRVTDSGHYTCTFPRLHGGQTFSVELVVGASPKPITRILNVTQDGVLVKCEVRGACPQPQLEWKDSDGGVLKAEEPQVSIRGGRYYASLITTVTMTTTSRFLCVARQENISHEVQEELYVPDKLFESCRGGGGAGSWMGGWCLGFVTVAAPLVVFVALKRRRQKGTQQ